MSKALNHFFSWLMQTLSNNVTSFGRLFIHQGHLFGAAISIIMLLSSGCSDNIDHRIIGEWKIDAYQSEDELIFDKDNDLMLVQYGRIEDGVKKEDGTKIKFRYEMDCSRNPIWLDFVGQNFGKDGQFLGEKREKGIMRFLTDTKLQVRINADSTNDNRPVDFDGPGTEILNKEK